MNEKAIEAANMFRDGYLCSQAVFAAYSEMLGLEKDLAFKIGNGFGAGIARRQEVCGAVSGAVMLIGLKYGKVDPNDSIAHEKTFKLVNDFCAKFIEKNKSINCHELLGCDMATAKEKGLFSTLCKKCIMDSVDIVGEILEDSEG
jgi:C_GCAxxG_C_C family probable redox protein